ncbi:MAG: iron-sulfur binding hydrogenase, partial [Spirochaetales bacterium]|nr:iron-sulfur binding hydrogenase [Spirochaetales bacterium]
EVAVPNQKAVITDGYTSDLLSDVMGNAPENSVLITIQAHKNTIAVASLVGMKAVVLCSGRSAPEDMLSAAAKEGIAVYSTGDSQFAATCKIGAMLS